MPFYVQQKGFPFGIEFQKMGVDPFLGRRIYNAKIRGRRKWLLLHAGGTTAKKSWPRETLMVDTGLYYWFYKDVRLNDIEFIGVLKNPSLCEGLFMPD